MQVDDRPRDRMNSFPDIERDEISVSMEKSWDELFSEERAVVEAWQLASARRRFDELMPKVKVLRSQAEANEVRAIDTLNDLVPLLFNHAAYKSYPMSFLEKGRFDMLTRWLDGMTSIDLSGVDVSRCTGIDNWLDTIEQQTPLQVYHTTGTTGRLSFIPRTTLERDMWNLVWLKMFEPFGDEYGEPVGGENGAHVPIVFAGVRRGRYATQRLVTHFEQEVAPTPDQCYTMSDGMMSADVISLSGRIRVAQAKGDLSSITLTEPMRIALREYLAELDRRPQEMSAFLDRMTEKLGGQRILTMLAASYLVPSAQAGLAKGISNIFAANSFGVSGGGNKDSVLPDNWVQILEDFTGIKHWVMGYGMTELTGTLKPCPEGYYHVPPYLIPYLLDPQTGAALPREGQQTGRFAALDLLAQTFWGGVISGDKVTIEWDRACTCGRKGAHIHNHVTRYDAKVTGDDKITCSATIDNSDTALHQLLAG